MNRINHFLCLFLLLPLAIAPAFPATTATKTSYQRPVAKHPIKRKRRTQYHHSPIVHKPAIDNSAKPAPLAGQVIYQEVCLPVTPTVPATSGSISPPTTEPLEQSQVKVEQPEKSSVVKHEADNHIVTLSTYHRITTGIKERSLVNDVTQEQSLQLANAIAAYVAKQVPIESTTLLLAPPQISQANNSLTPALNDSLRKIGFGLVEAKCQAPEAQVLRYQVCRLDDGLWVQICLNQTEANRFYSLDLNSNLVADAPFSVREAQ